MIFEAKESHFRLVDLGLLMDKSSLTFIARNSTENILTVPSTLTSFKDLTFAQRGQRDGPQIITPLYRLTVETWWFWIEEALERPYLWGNVCNSASELQVVTVWYSEMCSRTRRSNKWAKSLKRRGKRHFKQSDQPETSSSGVVVSEKT